MISKENLHEEGRLREAIRSTFGGRVGVNDQLGVVSAIGAGITASFENLQKGNAALRDVSAEVSGVATSSFRITWLVARESLDTAVRALHRALVQHGALQG